MGQSVREAEKVTTVLQMFGWTFIWLGIWMAMRNRRRRRMENQQMQGHTNPVQFGSPEYGGQFVNQQSGAWVQPPPAYGTMYAPSNGPAPTHASPPTYNQAQNYDPIAKY